MGISLGAVLRPRRVGLPDPVALTSPELNATWHSRSQRRLHVGLIALALLASAAFAALVLWLQIVSVIGLLTWVAIIAIAMRPYVGLCVAFGLTLLFEAGGADQLMLPGFYVHGGLGSTIGLTGAIASPLELLLVLTFLVWVGQGVMRRSFDFRGGALFRPLVAFVAAL